MRIELAAIISIVIGGLITFLLSLLGDDRAQHASTIFVASFPFVIFCGMLWLMLSRFILIKTASHHILGYLRLGWFCGVILMLCILLVGGGLSAGLSFGIGISVTYILFAVLQLQRKNA
ncbi:hypothetical protein JK628_14155 [Shewanella sp. KX20019]|uniref:hypothetical protein n=1 Tax=Shewanella sp. KX20019 TaxID=2803864 RepID=UPI001928F7D5|nr:hypothetical protein [Shewanella sp. KX20019]QQX78711.1 hypothetical protein JK628_14155 [Shewanella sp. KX20019]